MEWIIKKGNTEDAETIARFQMEMAKESEGTELDMNTLLKGVSAGLSDPSRGTYYLVRTGDGETVGSLFVTKEWSDWNNCWYWWIQSVYVKPEFRRKGAFTALYEHVRRKASEDGSMYLRLYVDRTNEKALRCYRKLGMAECHYLMYEESIRHK